MLQASLRQLVFGWDAIFNIPFKVDWQQIRKRKQEIVKKDNEHKNAKRIQFALGGLPNSISHDNPSDSFFDSENNCEHFLYIIWDNENVVENQDFNVPQPWTCEDLNFPFGRNFMIMGKARNMMIFPKIQC